VLPGGEQTTSGGMEWGPERRRFEENFGGAVGNGEGGSRRVRTALTKVLLSPEAIWTVRRIFSVSRMIEGLVVRLFVPTETWVTDPVRGDSQNF
jgi:hypothetical protein